MYHHLYENSTMRNYNCILFNVFTNEITYSFTKKICFYTSTCEQCININVFILQVFFALMLTPLFKKSKHVGIVEFFVTVAFGFVGLLIVLMESFPKSLVWLLSPFCQCTFLIGIAQVGNILILCLLNVFSNSVQHLLLLLIFLLI